MRPYSLHVKQGEHLLKELEAEVLASVGCAEVKQVLCEDVSVGLASLPSDAPSTISRQNLPTKLVCSAVASPSAEAVRCSTYSHTTWSLGAVYDDSRRAFATRPRLAPSTVPCCQPLPGNSSATLNCAQDKCDYCGCRWRAP